MDSGDAKNGRDSSATFAELATQSTTLPQERLQISDRLRSVSWTTRDLAIGLAVVMIARSLSFLPAESIRAAPPWLFVVAAGLFQVFLFAYPILRARGHGVGGVLHWPGPKKLLVEFAVSLLIVFGLLVVLCIVGLVLSRVSPHTYTMPSVFRQATSRDQISFVTAILILSVTIGPISEEIFFRGFLQNAFRSRWPIVAATVGQSLIFAGLHTFGMLHAAIALFLGLVLTVVYEWRKSLITPMFVHAGNNLFAAIATVVVMIANANSPVLGVYGHDHSDGCQIETVVPATSAAKAHIVEGDVITELNGERIHGFAHLSETVRRFRIGDSVTVGLNRNGEHLEITVVLEKRP